MVEAGVAGVPDELGMDDLDEGVPQAVAPSFRRT